MRLVLKPSISVLFGFTFKKALFSAFLGFNSLISIYYFSSFFSRLNYAFISLFFSGAGAKLALWILPKGRLVCRGKSQCANAGRHKIELKKMCGGKNKKYNRVGNECRITRCPVALWSVCVLSPVNSFKCVSVQCLLVSLFEIRSAWLAYNGSGLGVRAG